MPKKINTPINYKLEPGEELYPNHSRRREDYLNATDFKIIEANSLGRLENEVKSYLSDGWIPVGSFVFLPFGFGRTFYQSILKVR